MLCSRLKFDKVHVFFLSIITPQRYFMPTITCAVSNLVGKIDIDEVFSLERGDKAWQ